LPHLELAREIARRFNNFFGDTFPEPEAKLTSFPLVLGLNGKDKMSKQLGNDIELALSDEETIAKVKEAVTDPARRYRDDPGHPEVCNVFRLHGYFNPFQQEALSVQCRSAKIGCVDCKMNLAKEINDTLRPFRERRAELAARPQVIKDVLADGAQRARVIARETIKEVKQKMGLF
jgi:tryptophanyl-tRNA synthetase